MNRIIRLQRGSLVLLLALLSTSCSRTADPDVGHRETESFEHAAHTLATEDEHGHDEHGHEEHGDEGIVELGPEAIERIGLRTEPVARRSFVGPRTTTGTLGFDEERLAHVGPRVSGRLVRVPGTLGAVVAAGEPLAVLDSTELGEARAAFLRARARHEVAQRRFERQQTLFNDRISAEQEVLEAEAAARESAADLAVARETLHLLGLSSGVIEGLTWDDPESSLVSVRAPFASRVVSREATVGELVSPQQTLFTLADLSEVWLWIDLYERDLSRVAVGAQVEVRLDAWPGESFGGELAYIADQVDPASRTVRARVDLPNPQRRLKPGLFARVSLASGEEALAVLALPRTAVQRAGDETIVFVRTGPGRFERREVELGRTGDDLVEILAGVAEGAEVVSQGSFLLRSQASADDLGGHHH
ncbi:MAG: efflux RND transporter periplasmic adaptor subunit [Acidobacteriota bacterium]